MKRLAALSWILPIIALVSAGAYGKTISGNGPVSTLKVQMWTLGTILFVPLLASLAMRFFFRRYGRKMNRPDIGRHGTAGVYLSLPLIVAYGAFVLMLFMMGTNP